MHTPDDPYFAGRIAETRGKEVVGPPPVMAWIIVCAVNLIFPLYFGMLMTDNGGRIGMLIGIIVVMALGYRICFVSRSSVLAVVYGGWIVAALQFFPAVQVVAGSIGVGVAQAMTQAEGGDFRPANTLLGLPGGFLATIITGGILIAASGVLGLLIKPVLVYMSRRMDQTIGKV